MAKHAHEAYEGFALTYGVMPTLHQYREMFLAAVPDGVYHYTLRGHDAETAGRVGIDTDGRIDGNELYVTIKKLVTAFEAGDEDAGDLASGFLTTLGVEWI